MRFKAEHGSVVIIILLFSISTQLSSASAQEIVSLPPSDSTTTSSTEDPYIIDGTGIINTPYRNSSSPLFNIPFVRRYGRPLAIGRWCEQDFDCANFSICRLVVQNKETTKKICECDRKVMKQVNGSCYIKPGHQCYFPNKNEHGYNFIQCLPGSICKSSVNKDMPKNGYCMCAYPPLEDRYRELDVEAEMARCSGVGLMVSWSNYFGCALIVRIISSVHLV